MNSRPFYLSFLAIIAIACVLHIFLYFQEFYSISWDESGRTLDAYEWTIKKQLLRATVWLPFYRVVVGLGLEIFPDLFITPRIISFIFGIASLCSVTWLSYELFNSRQVALATAFLAAFFPLRVVLSLAPLSSIMFTFIILTSMAFFARWLLSGGSKALMLSAIFFAISGTIRYEGWVFSAAFLLVILASAVIYKERIKGRDVALLFLILSSFPLFWLMLHAFQTGNPVSFLERGSTYYSSFKVVILKNPILEFVKMNAVSLNLLGLVSVIYCIKNSSLYRKFIFIPATSLFLISAILLLSSSAQSGPAWRMVDVWSMLLIPFTVHFVLSQEKLFPRLKRSGIYGLALLMLIFMLHTYIIKKDSYWAFPLSERYAGEYLNDILINHPDEKILIESSNFFYLNIIVASQHPDAFVLNSVPEQTQERGSVVSLDKPLDALALGNMKINFLVFKTQAYKDLLDQNLSASKIKDFGNWSIYELQ